MATQEQLDRLHAVVPAAQLCAKLWRVPASVTLAQWIIESSWGTSQLARTACNCFGVKFSQKKGAVPQQPYVEMQTAEYEAGRRVIVPAEFVKYATVDDSFKAHAQLLADSPRYKPAMLVADHIASFTAQLEICGYSTNPHYADLLRQLIADYKLAQYDVPPAPEPAVAQQLQEAA